MPSMGILCIKSTCKDDYAFMIDLSPCHSVMHYGTNEDDLLSRDDHACSRDLPLLTTLNRCMRQMRSYAHEYHMSITLIVFSVPLSITVFRQEVSELIMNVLCNQYRTSCIRSSNPMSQPSKSSTGMSWISIIGDLRICFARGRIPLATRWGTSLDNLSMCGE